jgi:hypothetical protein
MAMTEERWLRSARPAELLDFLLHGGASGRKLRLYGVACARRVRRRPEQIEEAYAVIAVAERFADGLATAEELEAARPYPRKNSHWTIAEPGAPGVAVSFTEPSRKEAKQSVKAALLRDLFGNPFQERAHDARWLTPTVASLALAAYEERLPHPCDLDPVRLGILADALVDAGCADETILAHLRGPGPHVRGCWVLDLILGKGER